MVMRHKFQFGSWLPKRYAKISAWMIRHELTPFDFELFRKPLNFFYTWHKRPVVVPTPVGSQHDFRTFGVLVQGPVRKRRDFTYETLRGYSSMFPNATLVLSTWSDLGANEANKFRSLGVRVVLNQKPEEGGPANFNYQLRSTKAGLEEFDKTVTNFVLKQRTDQRIYSFNALTMLEKLTEIFPAADGGLRLVGSSLNTFADRDFGLSDMLHFSSLQEMKTLWGVGEVGSHFGTVCGREISTPEQFLTLSYLETRCPEFLDLSWKEALSQYLVIVDASSLDLLWPKYSRREHLWIRYSDEHSKREVSFAAWVSLLSCGAKS